MGCVVNGPGEARGCDIGLAGGVNEFLLFRKGSRYVRYRPAMWLKNLLVRWLRLENKKKAD